MATLAELQDALTNAHNAGDAESATALANEIVKMRLPWAAPSQSPIPRQAGGLSFLPDAVQAGVIGAGRVGSQVIAGAQQAGLSGLVAAKEAMGMNSRPQLDSLAALDQEQRRNAPIYGALQERYPLSTAIGEAAPSLAIPMGQATAAARIMAPAIGLGSLGMLQYGSPQERLIRGTVDAVGGLAGGATSELGSTLVQPVKSVASSAAQNAAKQAADKIGAPLLPSQQTGNPNLAIIEDSLARSPGSAGVLQRILAQQRAAVGRATTGAMGATGEDATQAVINTAKSDMGQQYDAFRAQIPNGMRVSQPVLDAVTKAKQALSQGSTQAPGKSGALSMLQELEDKLYQTKALTPAEYSGWVSDFAAAAREAKNPQVAAQLKGVGATMDAEARGPLAGPWKALDQSYAAARTLEKSGAFNPVTGEVMPGRLATYMQRHPSGANATSLADAAEFGRAVPQLRAGSPTFERGQVGMVGALNALWRYPLAKMITSDAMREYLANGLLASPGASQIGAQIAAKGLLPVSTTASMGLFGPLIPAYQ